MLTSRSSCLSGMSSASLCASLLMMFSKCVFDRFVCFLHSLSPARLHLSLECHCLKKKNPASALVILYRIAIICICAAVSASSDRFAMNALLSFYFLAQSRIYGL